MSSGQPTDQLLVAQIEREKAQNQAGSPPNAYELAAKVVNTLTEIAIIARTDGMPELANLASLVHAEASRLQRIIASLPLAVILNPQTIAEQQAEIERLKSIEAERIAILAWLTADCDSLIVDRGDHPSRWLTSVRENRPIGFAEIVENLMASGDGSNLRRMCPNCSRIDCTGCGPYCRIHPNESVPLGAPAEVREIFERRKKAK